MIYRIKLFSSQKLFLAFCKCDYALPFVWKHHKQNKTIGIDSKVTKQHTVQLPKFHFDNGLNFGKLCAKTFTHREQSDGAQRGLAWGGAAGGRARWPEWQARPGTSGWPRSSVRPGRLSGPAARPALPHNLGGHRPPTLRTWKCHSRNTFYDASLANSTKS